MHPGMTAAESKLRRLLDTEDVTKDLCIRIQGEHLVLGREERESREDNDPERDDRVRFTRISSSTFGLSVKRHTGRWERTPFSGPLDEMVDVLVSLMQHLIGPY